MKRQLQHLIPNKINIRKQTISGLTGTNIESKYYLSVDDYYKINETVNDIICALNTVNDNININLTSIDTIQNDVNIILTSTVPIITGINGEPVEGVINVNNLTAFYLNNKKYTFNEMNQGDIILDDRLVSGKLDNVVSSFNGMVGDVVGGISGIKINGKVYFPYKVFNWSSDISTLTNNTYIFFDDKKTNLLNANITNVYASGKINDFTLLNNMVLTAATLSTFKINVKDDYYLPAHTSAIFNNVLTEITQDSPGYIDWNLSCNVYDLTGDVTFYIKNGTKIFNWNSSLTSLPSYTSTTIDGEDIELTKFNSKIIENIYASGKVILENGNQNILTNESVLTTSFNGKVNLGNYYTNGTYITTINNEANEKFYLLSTFSYGLNNYNRAKTLTSDITIINTNFVLNQNNNLKYQTTPLTLKTVLEDDEYSAVNKKYLDQLNANKILSSITLTNNIIILQQNWYPLHYYNNEGDYVTNVIQDIQKLENGKNQVTLINTIYNGTLTIMKVG